MCGIAGILSSNHSNEELFEIGKKMGAPLHRRGPDGEGCWIDPKNNVALVHKRLSIIDLSENGAQPMASRCGRYTMTFNGEIYNFRKLRQELEGMGHTFIGHSDSEVLINLISKVGLEIAVGKLHGMYAFAVWDQEVHQLFLVRDRAGEKPLYYGWQNGQFLFGSDLSAIEAYPEFKKELNPAAIEQIIQFNCIPSPLSIYHNIFKLPPASILSVSLAEAGKSNLQTYWNPRDHIETPGYAGTQDEFVDSIHSQLKQVIKDQMVADVPVGCFLSGGIDSSLVAAIMQSQSERPIDTFTMGFQNPAYDESVYAKAIAKHIGSNHHEVIVDDQLALDQVPLLASIYSEPFADSSQIPTSMVSMLAAKEVKVCLSGDGGDEVFAGYNRYISGPKVWNIIKKMPAFTKSGFFQNTLGAMAHAIKQDSIPGVRLAQDKIHKILKSMGVANENEFYQSLISHDLAPSRFLAEQSNPTIFQFDHNDCEILKSDIAQGMNLLDFRMYLPDDILVKTDRASMYHSLELRVPFLDHKIIECSLSAPMNFKINKSQGKSPLKEILTTYVPTELFDRPKMGFAVPISQWLNGPLKPWAEELFSPVRIKNSNILSQTEVSKAWAKFLSGDEKEKFILWSLLMTLQWLESRGLH